MKNITNSAIAMGLIGLVIGFLLGWLIGRDTAPAPKNLDLTSNMESGSTTSVPSLGSGSSISVNSNSNALSTGSSNGEESDSAIFVIDQASGDMVTVASVETDVPAWVAVRESKDGILGNILGAIRVDAGASSNIMVSLLRPTVEGQTYQVVLFKDNGDKMFDHKIDVPLTSNGILISQRFTSLAR